MKTLNQMPSIEQFRSAVKSFNEDFEYNHGNHTPKPTITINGTVKMHGTNAGISYNNIDGVYYQSKKRVIAPGNEPGKEDNAGFAGWCTERQEHIDRLMVDVCEEYLKDLSSTITVFGEFVGKGIQKGVAVSTLEKTFIVFGIKIKTEGESSVWVDYDLGFTKYNQYGIYDIKQFKTYKVDVDFNEPALSINRFAEIVDEIEHECPVGKFFGVSGGTGEGVVFGWWYNNKYYTFKCKGEKHAQNTRVRKTNKIDEGQLKELIYLVDKITPVWRLEQMYQEVFDTLNGGKGDIKKTGDFLRSVINDINKEEFDIIEESGFKKNDINKRVSRIARGWFMKVLDTEL